MTLTSINTHRLNMKGLKKASGMTKDYGVYSPEYVQIHYCRSTGEVFANYLFDVGHNTVIQFGDRSVIFVCNAHQHMTMQDIADAIAERVTEVEALEAKEE